MWNAILWGQLGAAIDMLGNAITACPDEHWSDPSRRPEWRRKSAGSSFSVTSSLGMNRELP